MTWPRSLHIRKNYTEMHIGNTCAIAQTTPKERTPWHRVRKSHIARVYERELFSWSTETFRSETQAPTWPEVVIRATPWRTADVDFKDKPSITTRFQETRRLFRQYACGYEIVTRNSDVACKGFLRPYSNVLPLHSLTIIPVNHWINWCTKSSHSFHWVSILELIETHG